jgi:hypothetical protein
MIRRAALAAVAAILLLVFATVPAAAEISLFWQPVPITATTDSVTPPPGIAGYECWDLMGTLTPGDDFTWLRILWDPPTPIFQHVLGQGVPNFGPPPDWQPWPFPALQFDSYLRSPSGGQMTVLGLSDDTPSVGIFDNERIALRAGDLSTQDQGGTFQLLRLTVGAPAPLETVVGRVFSRQVPDGVPIVIPEPSLAALLACAAGPLMRRRRLSLDRRRVPQ